MDNQAMTSRTSELNAARPNGRKSGPNDDGRTAGDLRAGGDMVMRSAAGFGENLLNLAELQARLARIELGQNIEAARAGVFWAIGGAVAVCSGLIIMLAGIAELLVSEFGVKRGVALLSVAASAIGVGSICLVGAALRLRAKRLGFPLSYEELARNLNWLRTVVRQTRRRRR